jgi:ABC-2 type transport system permease protein
MVEHIQKGTLDFVIIKPASSQFLATLTACSPLKSLDIILGFALIVCGLYRQSYTPGPLEIATFTLMLVSGALIVYSLWLLLVTLAFWFVRVDNFTEIFSTFFEAGRFPVSVYRGWVRVVLTFIVPIAFLTTFPAASLLGRISPLYPSVSVILAAALLVISHRFWNYAIRFYSSASS